MSHFPQGNQNPSRIQFGPEEKKTGKQKKKKKRKALSITPVDARCSASKTFGDFLEHIKMHKHTPTEPRRKWIESKPNTRDYGGKTTLAQGSCRVGDQWQISPVNARREMQTSL